MARNDQVIRQWHLLRRLEGSAALTLEELAAGLPDDLPRHLRTLRRDLTALETVGFSLTTDQARKVTQTPRTEVGKRDAAWREGRNVKRRPG